MDISVITVNYKSKKFLKTCFLSLNNIFQESSWEIILVNNDETPLSVDLLKQFGNLKVIENNKNIGYAKACNLGAKEAAGKILFFLNPDTSIEFANPNNLIKTFNQTNVGIVAPQILLPSKKVQPWSAGGQLNFYSLVKNNFIGKDTFDYTSSEAFWVSGAAMFVTKDLFFEIGGFDENYFMYFEDMDFCKKVIESGKKILRSSELSVIHFGGQSYNSIWEQKKDYYCSQDYYFKKNYGTIVQLGVKLLRTVRLLTRF